MEWLITSETEWPDVAKDIAPRLKKGDIVALYGTLGVGKTTFVRALVSELLREKVDVPSPTFTLVQSYDTPDFVLYHFDCYRLNLQMKPMKLGSKRLFGMAFR